MAFWSCFGFPLLMLLLVLLAVPVLLLPLYLRCVRRPSSSNRPRVLVLVLGDVGRSPRTQYHAVSLANAGFAVDLVGYPGTLPLPAVRNSPYIQLAHVPAPAKLAAAVGGREGAVRYLVAAVERSLRQMGQLLRLTLFKLPAPEYILIQNPPAIPSLLLGQYLRLALGSKLVIDWHNFGFSIMALNLGARSPIVRIATLYEKSVGRFATAHICVSKAMASELKTRWRVRGSVTTMYDKSPSHFRRLSVAEIHEFATRYSFATAVLTPTTTTTTSSPRPPTRSLLTHIDASGRAQLTPTRPALLVSSTSWTEDEDFGILLDALVEYDQQAEESNAEKRVRDLVLVITGKGPLQAGYVDRIARLKMTRVRILTAWLTAEDYPLLLGAADLGISLHTSSSGVDLPMKIVDMFGCSLPVCAVDYPCLRELVEDGVNGRVFGTAGELCKQLQELLSIDDNACQLAELREGATTFADTRWHDAWMQDVAPLFGVFGGPRR
ncbi:mannosyltransferase [Geranomyces variabilis]|uniref:Chitobiosyldiphosphodolichol beta-mannosyltransferase n=1 Tax=Geranomyces variabilis TaxID=109894 RepID=A0AAD5XJP6_9FUNG|nr:mannosyltransferase [Geranomyces variabilis]